MELNLPTQISLQYHNNQPSTPTIGILRAASKRYAICMLLNVYIAITQLRSLLRPLPPPTTPPLSLSHAQLPQPHEQKNHYHGNKQTKKNTDTGLNKFAFV